MVNPIEGLITRDDLEDIAETKCLILDDEECISVLETMCSIDVQACPGSGKTTLIAAKLILIVKKWSLRHQGICVLSHTNVAEDEIIDRLKRSKTIEAHRWLNLLTKGKITSINELAEHLNEDLNEISRFLPLAFLAPDIIEKILAGKQPIDLTL